MVLITLAKPHIKVLSTCVNMLTTISAALGGSCSLLLLLLLAASHDNVLRVLALLSAPT